MPTGLFLRSLRRLFVLFALLLPGLPLGCTRSSDSGLTTPLAVGQPLPPLQAAGWLNGEPPKAEELSGKVVVIDCWAHWCGPCRADAPHVVQTYHRFQGQEVVFVGLTAEGEEALAATKAVVAEANMPWPNGYGAEETMRQLEVKVLPTKIIFGRDGKVAWHSELAGDFEEEITKALQQPSTGA